MLFAFVQEHPPRMDVSGGFLWCLHLSSNHSWEEMMHQGPDCVKLAGNNFYMDKRMTDGWVGWFAHKVMFLLTLMHFWVSAAAAAAASWSLLFKSSSKRSRGSFYILVKRRWQEKFGFIRNPHAELLKKREKRILTRLSFLLSQQFWFFFNVLELRYYSI